MSTLKFIVGTLKSTNAALIFKNVNLKSDSDSSEEPDENGNLKLLQYYNHRVVLTATAVCPKGAAIPIKGETVGIKGLTLPAYSADGSVAASGKNELTVAADPAAATDSLDFVITDCSLDLSNTQVPQYSVTLTRWLENGIGAVTTEVTTA